MEKIMSDILRNKILDAAVSHFQGHVDKHKANIEVLLANPVGTANADILEALQKELEQVDHYDSLLDTLKKYY
jgi:hypothetical protein